MRPPDVIVTYDDETPPLTIWTRKHASGDIVVSFYPSPDLAVRAKQEADLARHLDERTPMK